MWCIFLAVYSHIHLHNLCTYYERIYVCVYCSVLRVSHLGSDVCLHTHMQTHSFAHTHAYNGSVCSSSSSNSRNMYVMYTTITVAIAADVLFLFFMWRERLLHRYLYKLYMEYMILSLFYLYMILLRCFFFFFFILSLRSVLDATWVLLALLVAISFVFHRYKRNKFLALKPIFHSWPNSKLKLSQKQYTGVFRFMYIMRLSFHNT